MGKIFIETYGCTLNNADSDIMGELLATAGHSVHRGLIKQEDSKTYDYVILNTCTVKKPTEQKIISKLERLSKFNKNIIVTGCLASASPELIKKAAPEAKILSTKNTTKILTFINPEYTTSEIYEKPFYVNSTGSKNNIITRIPVSEGCLSNCSFCETKFARGPLKSFDEKLILRAISNSVKNGFYEIEITSQDIGAYGADKKTNIAELLSNAILIDGDFKIRVGMLNPEHLHKYLDDLFDVMKNKKVFKFLHLPIQSGSNKVLKSMKRNYTIEDIKSYFDEVRKKIPAITIETDVIVGYPNETREDFKSTESFLLDSKPTITNISKFWKRPHTSASKMPQISINEIKRRSTQLSRSIRNMQVIEYGKLIGSVEEVVITENNKGLFSGRDDYYRPIAVLGDNLSIGDKIRVEIIKSTYACAISRKV
ncbi:MAG: tRNA (N(6)-L-threonylcarbamoyladenosine(37)-C(2))-methylthiotransferase [Candidatus Micrarchaeia archaeon]